MFGASPLGAAPVGSRQFAAIALPSTERVAQVPMAAPDTGGMLFHGPLPGAKRPSWPPEKGSYWEVLLSPPAVSAPDARPVSFVDAPPLTIPATPIARASARALAHALRRSAQAAANAARQQALADLQQSLMAQQWAIAQTLRSADDEDAILALLLA